MALRGAVAVLVASGLFLGGVGVAQSAPDTGGRAEVARAATQAPKGVEFIYSTPNKRAIKAGVPISVRYLGNLRHTPSKPESFALYAVNSASGVYELQAVSLADCSQSPKRGARCTFNDLPPYWGEVARDADRLAVAASNAAGEGPRALVAGTWLGELDSVAECIEGAADAAQKKIQFVLAGAIAGTMAGLVASAFTAGIAAGPVLAIGGTAVVSATAALAVTGQLKDAAKVFLEAVRDGASEEVIEQSGKGLLKVLGKLGLKLAQGVAGALAVGEVKDAETQYFISAEAC